MFQSIQDKSVQLLETIIERLEEYDQLKKRPRVFGQGAVISDDDYHGSQHSSTHGEEVPASDKLKQLSFELIDIGLHSSKLALELVQESDIISGLQEKFKALDDKVRDNKIQLFQFINDRVYTPIKSNLYVIYDRSTQVLSFVMQVALEHQQKLREYLAKHYENVQVLVRDNWMRLDFNRDGHVSIEDIK